MFAIAAATGWERDFVLWGMSYPELLVWQHCQLRTQGEWTVEPVPGSTVAEQVRVLQSSHHVTEGQFQV